MSHALEPTERTHMTVETRFEPANVNVRIKIAALWTSMLFIFAYVDIFSLYRPDRRAALEAGEIGGFTINQA
jgi:cbb3-type cytochrome oxidase subunit 3